MRNKLFKVKVTLWTLYYCNQYIIRYFKGRYDSTRVADEIELELQVHSRRIRGE